MYRKIILSFILGGLIFGTIGVIAAYKYQAVEVGYTPSNSNFEVDNVSDAISELYDKTNDCKEYYSKATYVAPKEGETHKGIVYLDPTDLKKKCTEKEAANNVNENGTPTEVKTGCMKWYVYDDSGDDYTMILDHNTTARIKWNDDNITYSIDDDRVNLKKALNELLSISKWKVTPRLISNQEIAVIIDATSINVTDGTEPYLEGTGTNKQTLPTFNKEKRSKYAWLYNNSAGCKTSSTDYGCEIEDNNSYTGYGTADSGQTQGYYTSTAVSVGVYGGRQYLIQYNCRLGQGYYSASIGNWGVRPVITISKSVIK